MPELDLPQRQSPDSLMLTGFWYRALPADRVHRNHLYKAMLLEIPLVIGRDRIGQPFALRDTCPHRGMPLNCGRFDGENLECGYHGWQFDVHNGQCQLIPSLTADQNLKVDRIYAGSYPCEEQDDFIWVFIPDPGPPGAGFAPPIEAPEAAPQIEKFSLEIQTRLPASRNARQHRPRHHRTHGSGARPIRPPGMVVAHPAQHSREEETFRAHPERLSHERAHAQFQLRALQIAAPLCRRRFHHHHHRFRPAQLRTETIRAGKYWFSSLTTVTPDHAQSLPHRCSRRLESVSLGPLGPRRC